MKKVVVSCFVLGLVIFSCDVPGKIELVNKTSEEAYYNVYSSGKSDTLNIKVVNKTILLYGFGHRWTKSTVYEYLNNVKKIEIISKSDSLVLEDKDKMMKFFLEKRKGLFNKRIKIVIK
jgi:hypothetical protein